MRLDVARPDGDLANGAGTSAILLRLRRCAAVVTEGVSAYARGVRRMQCWWAAFTLQQSKELFHWCLGFWILHGNYKTEKRNHYVLKRWVLTKFQYGPRRGRAVTKPMKLTWLTNVWPENSINWTSDMDLNSTELISIPCKTPVGQSHLYRKNQMSCKFKRRETKQDCLDKFWTLSLVFE